MRGKQKRIELAGCVIQDGKGRILLIHRNSLRRVQWELPGGKRNLKESPKDAAQRELKEELGVDVTIQKELGGKDFEEDGYLMSYRWFLAEVASSQKPFISEPHTFDKLSYFGIDNLNKIKDELSENAKNLLTALNSGTVKLPR